MVITAFCYLIFLITTIYFFSYYKFSYWKTRKTFYFEPDFFYGNLKDTITKNTPISSTILDIYKKARNEGHRFFGYYKFWTPVFVPVDLDLVKSILQTDFAHFPNHFKFGDEQSDPLIGNLFSLHDDKWRQMRSKLSPTFTPGKLKMMFNTMLECSKNLQKVFEDHASVNEPIDCKDALERFTIDLIGNVGFGVDPNTLKQPDSEFRKQGIKLLQFTYKQKIKLFIFMVFPTWLVKIFRLAILTQEAQMFFVNLVQQTVKYREENNVFRKDFMHLLIQLKNFGRVTNIDESSVMNKDGQSVKGLTTNEMAAQCFVFYLAGYETSSTAMTFALIELTQNMDIQDKAREEMCRILKKYDNQMTYEAMMEMEYLEKIILESLRKYPPLYILPRVCTKDYRVPGTDLILKAGSNVEIPALAIQRDPEYYPEPQRFDPERFNAENSSQRHSCAFLPFGEGPRICIGLRMGKLQAKIGLCSILSKFRVTLNEKTKLPIMFNSGLSSTIKGRIYLNLEPII